MATVPTIRMKKETAVITVNADTQAEWEKHGFKVLDDQAPAKDGDKAPDQPNGKKAPAKDGDK